MGSGPGFWWLCRLIVMCLLSGASLGISLVEHQPLACGLFFSTWFGANHLIFIGLPFLVAAVFKALPEGVKDESKVADFFRWFLAAPILVIRGIWDACRNPTPPKSKRRE